jgi:hypothetical protein
MLVLLRAEYEIHLLRKLLHFVQLRAYQRSDVLYHG